MFRPACSQRGGSYRIIRDCSGAELATGTDREVAEVVRKLRDVLTLIVFGIVMTVSIAAAIEAARQGLPEPVVSDPLERLRWLSLHDIRAEPRDVKLRFAHQLEEDFSQKVDWQGQIELFNDSQWNQFEANFDDLMRLWFMQKVDTWSSLPGDEQNLYLDDQLGYLMSWKALQRDAPKNAPDGRRRRQQKMASFTAVSKRVQGWMASESPEQRGRIESFVKAVIDRLVQRMTNPVQVGGQSWD